MEVPSSFRLDNRGICSGIMGQKRTKGGHQKKEKEEEIDIKSNMVVKGDIYVPPHRSE
jgi:hypothetical protein